jgi:hypothetical protein
MLNNTSHRRKRESAAPLPLEPLLDEYQVASILRRSVASLRRDRLHQAGCPFVKLGSLCRYRVSDVLAFIESNTRGGGTERVESCGGMRA